MCLRILLIILKGYLKREKIREMVINVTVANRVIEVGFNEA